MALFQHAEGSIPDSLEDFELTGNVLANIHRVAHDYAGPPSRYTLNGHHLAGRTLEYLRVYPDLGMVFKTPVKPEWRERCAAGTMAS